MYEFTSKVRFSEVNPDLKMNMKALMNRFQDASVFHSAAVGLGPKPVGQVEHAWVIVSWQIMIHRMPTFNEALTTSTWGWKFRGIEGDRDFTVKNDSGELLACAASRWIYFDFQTQRPIRVPQSEIDAYGVDAPLDIERAPRRIQLPKDAEVRSGEPVSIGRERLDNNRHVNNLEYIDMAMDEIENKGAVREIRVEYSHQAYLKDVLTPTVYAAEDRTVVTLQRSEEENCAVIEFLY